jgi:hypothetical protein
LTPAPLSSFASGRHDHGSHPGSVERSSPLQFEVPVRMSHVSERPGNSTSPPQAPSTASGPSVRPPVWICARCCACCECPTTCRDCGATEQQGPVPGNPPGVQESAWAIDLGTGESLSESEIEKRAAAGNELDKATLRELRNMRLRSSALVAHRRHRVMRKLNRPARARAPRRPPSRAVAKTTGPPSEPPEPDPAPCSNSAFGFAPWGAP